MKTHGIIRTKPGFAALAAWLPLALAACDSSEPSPVDVHHLDSQTTAALTLALQDEYLARITFAKVTEDLGDLTPFINIALSEAQHVEQLADLFTSHGLTVPQSTWNEDNVPTFATLAEACTAAAAMQMATIELYDELLAEQPPEDVARVFENLQAASVQSHLPAFTACAAGDEGRQQPGFDPVAALTPAIQDEYRAYHTYSRVLADLGPITPFSNIVSSEAQHILVLTGLFVNRGFEAPESEWNEGNVPAFSTRTEACVAAAASEGASVALYDALLAMNLPMDVMRVLTNLRAASLESHLPAFTACGQDGGGGDPPGFDPETVLTAAIQDEYRAYYTYSRVLADLGSIKPFSNIVLAEAQHATAVSKLFVNRGLDVPESSWSLDNVPVFATGTEACAAGVAAEEANVAMYDGFLSMELPTDVATVFTNLRAASLESHLPAFTACAEDGGGGDPPGFDAVTVLTRSIQDEHRAYYTYSRVLADLGSIKPFSNIVLAEAKHVSAVTGLFVNRGLEVPESDWTLENVPTFSTRAEACTAGVLREEGNVAMYDELLALDLPTDVVTVFTNLRAASLTFHLPAFTACAEGDPGTDPPGFDPIAVLTPAIQDEYRAYFTYSRVLADLGSIKPFSNIVLAEAKHVSAVADLFVTRGLEVPESDWTLDNVPGYGTRAEACAAGAAAEEASAAIYDGLLALELPADVALVFASLRAASLESHLPAFTACAN